MKKPSAVEQSIGLSTYYSTCDGIGGILRFQPEDFKVKEISNSFPNDSSGNFLLAEVEAKNWETNDLIRECAKKLRISKKRISFAGTKDKRAVTTQILCFYRIKKDQIESITIPDVKLFPLHRTSKRVNIGDLKGNQFTIVIREISSTITKDQIDEIINQFTTMNGFPNFFGVQRFGGIRPITHKVGRAMVNADFKQAVLHYLTDISEFEGNDATIARKNLAKSFDFKEGFHEFPKRLRFEKILMQHLDNHPDDYTGALKMLPSNLLTMFVYAFQSFLFNRMLSLRIKNELPIDAAMVGDSILPITSKGISSDTIKVKSQNQRKVNEQIKKGKAVVSCVIPGSETRFATGEMGEIQQKVIEEEHVDIRDFIIPEVIAASSYGTNRAILSPLDRIAAHLDSDEFNKSKQKLSLSFSLMKGSYATSFLREIMKLDDITKY